MSSMNQITLLQAFTNQHVQSNCGIDSSLNMRNKVKEQPSSALHVTQDQNTELNHTLATTLRDSMMVSNSFVQLMNTY